MAVGEMSYSATLGPLFCLNGTPWETVVYWTDLMRTSVVPYREVEFLDQMGKWCRKRWQTQFLEDEQVPVRGRKKVKAGHGKAKAIEGFKRMLHQTTNTPQVA